MKKTTTKLALLLVIISMLTMACGSDTKKEESKPTNKKGERVSGSANKKKVSSDSDDSNSSDNDQMISDIEAVLTKDIEAACVKIQSVYSDFKNEGNELDGLNEVVDAYGIVGEITTAYGVYEDDPKLAKYDFSGADDNYYAWLESSLYPFQDAIGAIEDKLSVLTDDQLGPKTMDINLMHTYMSDLNSAVTNAGFGDCGL